MEFDLKGVIRRIQEYYGEPLDITERDDMRMGRPTALVTFEAMSLAAKIPVESEIDVEAQVEAINWLIGRCEDQMVRGWLVQERELCKSAGGVKA